MKKKNLYTVFFLTFLALLLSAATALAGTPEQPCPSCQDTTMKYNYSGSGTGDGTHALQCGACQFVLEQREACTPDVPKATCAYAQYCTKCQATLESTQWRAPEADRHPQAALSYSTKNATCTEAGYSRYISCQNCNAYFKDPNATEIPPLGHDFSNITPDCTLATAQCTRCSDMIPDPFPHTPDRDAPTCGDPQVCTACSTELKPATQNHTFDSTVTCKDAQADCTTCSHTVQQPIAHTESILPKRDPDCAPGWNAGVVCTACNTVLSGGEPLDPIADHTLPAGTNCGSPAVVKCAVCGEDMDNPYFAKHTPDPAHPATCSDMGLCLNCQQPVFDYDIDTHKEADVVVEDQDTFDCDTDGYTAGRVCSQCDRPVGAATSTGFVTTDFSRFHSATGHTPDPAHPATCSEMGLCLNCQQPVFDYDIDTHKEADVIVEEQDTYDCLNDGYTAGRVCEACDRPVADAVPGSAYTVTDFSRFVTDAGHKPGKAATCTSPQTCTICGEILHHPMGHAFGAFVNQGDVDVSTCTRCGTTRSLPCRATMDDYTVTTGDATIPACPLCGRIHTQQATPVQLTDVTVKGKVPSGAKLLVYTMETPFEGANLGLTVAYQKNGEIVKTGSLTVTIQMAQPQGSLLALLDGELVAVEYTYEDGILTFNTLGANVFYFVEDDATLTTTAAATASTTAVATASSDYNPLTAALQAFANKESAEAYSGWSSARTSSYRAQLRTSWQEKLATSLGARAQNNTNTKTSVEKPLVGKIGRRK